MNYNLGMFGLLILLWLASLVVIVIAFIKPSIFEFIFRKTPSRKKAGLTAIGISLLIFISMFPFVPSDSSSISASSISKPSIATHSTKPAGTPKKEAAKATSPTPTTDPCQQYAGTDQMQTCVQLQKAKEPQLNATVTYSDEGMAITNNDNSDWTGCDITIGADRNLDTSYELGNFTDVFPARQTTVVPWGNLTQSDGTRFDYSTTQPTDVEIDCGLNGKDAYKKIY